MLHSQDLTRVRWRCIHFVTAEGIGGPLRDRLTAADIRLHDLHGGNVRGTDDFFRELAAAMAFPDYFGRNWDAVLDCLRDLPDRQPAKGHVLFVHEADWLWRRCFDPMGPFIEVWLSAAEEAAGRGLPLHLVFASAAPPTAVA